MGSEVHGPMTRREAAVALAGFVVAFVLLVWVVTLFQAISPPLVLETRDCPVPHAIAFPSGCQP